MSTIASRFGIAIGHFLYGLYSWTLFLLLLMFALLFSTVIPGLERRRRWVGYSARSFFALAGMSPTVSGMDRMPEHHCVVVANHASYLDGVILQAFLPPRFSYVIKGEVRNVPVVHFFLRRIGARFVERFIAAKSTRDARNLVRAAAAGESLAFFPEGTFLPEPGLSRFRPGAFVAALKGALPVVPVVIRGSRTILSGGSMMPRPGKLRIDVLQPILTGDGTEFSSAGLAELARQRILPVLDEPDLLLK